MARTVSLAAVALAATVALVWAIGNASPAGAAKSPTAELKTALADAGFYLTPVSPDDLATISAKGIEPSLAAEVAVRTYGQVDPPVVYVGLLTVSGYHVGGPDTALAVADRAVYAVQLTGLNLPPFGGPATIENLHHELIAFVDVATGELLLATTVR
jgi:hypothetical protein